MTNFARNAGIAATCLALALGACNNDATDKRKTTTRMTAIDVPDGTISDALIPLDTRNDAPTTIAAANQAAANETSIAIPTAETGTVATNESETEQ